MENNMALPLTEHPLIDVYVHSLDREVKFRPFLVKEEKLLVLANETKDQSEMIKATQQVVTNCSFGEVMGDEIPVFDMQNIFLELRKVSISDTVNIRLVCGHCEKSMDVDLSLDAFKLNKTEGHSKEFSIAEDISLEMRYPTATELAELGKSETENDIYRVAEKCIEKIYYGDVILDEDALNPEEREEFVNNLTSEQFVHIKNFFETMPVIENTIEYKCASCEKENTAYLNGYYDFFV
jgi:hypothetical protein|tara:strand:- start:213 stop:926 length:714 start_codon:yes stop_codon:yes gene_type:complete